MSTKVPSSFFEAKSLLFVGYSKRHAAFCKSIREAYESRGASVFPVNPGVGPYDVKVYASIAEVPVAPDLALVLTNKSRNEGLLGELAAKGVKRVLFGSKVSADAAILARCAALGMEGAIACPLEALGKGFHRFHGWLAGIPRIDAHR